MGSGQANGQAAGEVVTPNVDPKTGIVHSRRLASGVPLGGIGTGTFQVMTDGSISRATINNNWNQPTGDLPGCFAAIWTQAGSQKTARVLVLKNGYQLPSVKALDYDGLYPQALMTFPDPALPLKVSLRAFAPLIPHDVKNSSIPAAAFVFRVQNTAPVPIEVSVALAWENTLGVGGTAGKPFHNRSGNSVKSVPDAEGFFSLQFTGPPPPADPTVEERLRLNAGGDMTLMTFPERPQAQVTTAGWNALDSRPSWWDTFAQSGAVSGSAPLGEEGRVHPAGVLAVHLTLKPREAVEIPFAIAWNTPHLNTRAGVDYGHYYQTIFRDSAHSAHALLAEWRSLLGLTEEWQGRLLFSNLPLWITRRLINSATPLTEHSLHTRDSSFAFLDSVGTASAGTDHAEPPDAFDTLSRRLAVSALLMNFFPRLEARELRTFMAMQSPEGDLPSRLGEIEGLLGPPPPGTVPYLLETLRLTPGPPLSRLNAEEVDSLAAFVLQMAQYVFCTGDREFIHLYFPHVRRALRRLLAYRDEDGLPLLRPTAAPLSGPENAGAQTAPAAPFHASLFFLRNEGVGSSALTPSSATLVLAALKAGQKLAGISSDQAFLDTRLEEGLRGLAPLLEGFSQQEEDRVFALTCEEAYSRAAAGTRKRFWNGQFYAEPGRAGTLPSANLTAVSSSDQLIGQWMADQLDLGVLLSGEETAKALRSLQSRSSSRNIKGAGAFAVPLARAGSNGAPDGVMPECILPSATLAVGVLSILQRQPEAGVTVLKGLDEAQNNVLGSPWQSPLTFRLDAGPSPSIGLASVTHSADWNMLNALEGFTMDLSAGRLKLSPQIPGTWRTLRAPVFAPTFWGRVEFKPTARGELLTFRLDRLIALVAATPSRRLSGSAGLILTSLQIPGPPTRIGAPAAAPPVAHVSRGVTPLGVKTTVDAATGDLILVFETPLRMAAGDRLEVDVH